MLNALVAPTIHKTESGAASIPIAMVCPNKWTSLFSDIPHITAMVAPMTWARNFGPDRSGLMSSQIDTKMIGSNPRPTPTARRRVIGHLAAGTSQ